MPPSSVTAPAWHPATATTPRALLAARGGPRSAATSRTLAAVAGLATADPAGPCVPVLVKGIVLSVESGVIRRGPDSRRNFGATSPEPVTTAAPPRRECARQGLDPIPPPNRKDETMQDTVDQAYGAVPRSLANVIEDARRAAGRLGRLDRKARWARIQAR